MSKKTGPLHWYVVHTYSGHENKVKASLERIVESRGMEDVITDIEVPMEEVIEVKDGLKKKKLRKVFPGYVIVRMNMNDESWYVVRNTKGVTGFVGPGSKPVPLSAEELRNMGLVQSLPELTVEVGDTVSIISGPFTDYVGIVRAINTEKHTLTILISMFGRETPVELEYGQIEKL
ncbi:MAG: transcription termination/antitermination protein NusG [Tissierellia bacterium]|jgi:transcriptional antiterminator NusG|nr:transcription termination/antitermination protein NusG [Bacillota bacterium]NLL23396.1 transcription termination/antitermination protein NusG [Tissierellia bacterium]